MKVLVRSCSVASKKSLKLSLVLNVKAGKTKVACRCHRLAIGLIFLLVVVWWFCLFYFFPLFLVRNPEKDFSESFHFASHILGQPLLAPFKLSHDSSHINKRQI